MTRYEYKFATVKLKGQGVFGLKRAEGFEETIQREGLDGWRYVDTLSETGAYGEVGRIKLIFERELA